MVVSIGARAASARRRRAAQALLAAAGVCLVVGLALVLVDYFGPVPVYEEGPFDPQWSDLSPSQQAGGWGIRLLSLGAVMYLVATGLRIYDAWRLAALGEPRQR